MADVVVRDLARRYGGVVAVEAVSFTVKNGEFLTLLGPSGCGKSTTLGLLAGLDRPDEGFMSVGGETFFDTKRGHFVEAEKRNLGLVFQSYALWPHMTVRDNIAFALKLRKIDRGKRELKVREALALVEMETYIDRYPNQLSGGQQQRVALARTLAYRPTLLLLDEPLSNLDAKLRDKARSWLRQLQSQVGITTIFVTHDQAEALALSDRVAVMDRGRIVQLGTPREIYDQPATPFVADFIGSSNFFKGTVRAISHGKATITLTDGQILVVPTALPLLPDQSVNIACRPERIRLSPVTEGVGENTLRAKIVEESYLGSRVVYTLQAGSEMMRVEATEEIGERDVVAHLPQHWCTVFRAS
jgi:iron(III) transport system ATP-binding protein